jgi:hypothetical protein
MSPDPPVLDYRRREPKPPSGKPAPNSPAFEMLVFFIGGVLGFIFFWMIAMGAFDLLRSSGRMRNFGVSFAILGIAVLIYGVITHSHRRFFLAGLLVGCGLAMASYGCILFMASYAMV